MYNQSTYDQSYYNNNGMNVARTSTEGGAFTSDAMSEGRYKNMHRTNSAAAGGGRRQRPMTAKVKNSGLR